MYIYIEGEPTCTQAQSQPKSLDNNRLSLFLVHKSKEFSWNQLGKTEVTEE